MYRGNNRRVKKQARVPGIVHKYNPAGHNPIHTRTKRAPYPHIESESDMEAPSTDSDPGAETNDGADEEDELDAAQEQLKTGRQTTEKGDIEESEPRAAGTDDGVDAETADAETDGNTAAKDRRRTSSSRICSQAGFGAEVLAAQSEYREMLMVQRLLTRNWMTPTTRLMLRAKTISAKRALTNVALCRLKLRTRGI